MATAVPVENVEIVDTEQVRHEQTCQTSQTSEFPPLFSAKQLKKERGTAKSKHTKLITKIRNHITAKGNHGELKHHRSLLIEQLERCHKLHAKFREADDCDENDDEYITEIEGTTRDVYKEIDAYLQATQPAVAAGAIRNINDEKASSIGSSVSKANRTRVSLSLGDLQATIFEAIKKQFETEKKTLLDQTTKVVMSVKEKERENLKELTLAIDRQTRLLEIERKKREEFEFEFRTHIHKQVRLNETEIRKPKEKERPKEKAEKQTETVSKSVGTDLGAKPKTKSFWYEDSGDDVNEGDDNDDDVKSQPSEHSKSKSDCQSSACMHKRKSVIRLPKIDMEQFDGNPKNWPTFFSNFKELVDSDPHLSTGEKMAILKKCLKPDIRESLSDHLNNPESYLRALYELESSYGSPYVVSGIYIRTVLNLPKLQNFHDYQALIKFSSQLRGAVSSLKEYKCDGELKGRALLEIVMDKLPLDVQSRWGEVITAAHPKILKLEDFVEWFNNRVKAEMMIKQGKVIQQKPAKPRNSGPAIYIAAAPVSNDDANDHQCPMCKGGHRLEKCADFKILSIEDRAKKIRALGCCLKCLTKGHISKNCPNATKCTVGQCKYNHHTLLHGAPRIFSIQEAPVENVAATTPTSTAANVQPSEQRQDAPASVGTYGNDEWSVLLAVVPVIIRNGSKTFNTFALLDNGSEATLILKSAAEKIGVEGPERRKRLVTFHGQDPDIEVQEGKFVVSSRDGSATFAVQHCYVIPKLNLARKSCNWPKLKRHFNHLVDLDLPSIDTSLVTVLLGCDARGVHDVLEKRMAPLGEDGPDAVLTPFGWCITVPVPSRVFNSTNYSPRICTLHIDNPADAELRKDIEKMWEVERGSQVIEGYMSKEDKRAVRLMEDTTRHTGVRYEIGFPWRSEDVSIPNNRVAAIRKLENLQSRFIRDPHYAELYDRTIQEYIQLGHAVEQTQERGICLITVLRRHTNRIKLELCSIARQGMRTCVQMMCY